MSTEEQREPTEDELRAAYETQVKKLRVDHVVLETVVTLANLGMRRTGLAPGTEDERDVDQVRMAIESIRALTPLLEQISPEQVAPVRDALSQLQLAYVRIGGSETGRASTPPPDPGSQPPGSGASPGSGPGSQPEQPGSGQKREDPGPAQRSGRLWVPGQ
jgi:hypothetical protein